MAQIFYSTNPGKAAGELLRDFYIERYKDKKRLTESDTYIGYRAVEHPEFKGFYIIPDERYSNYVISPYGVIKQLIQTAQKAKGSIVSRNMNNGYLSSQLRFPNGEYKKAKNHILVCLAFHGPRPAPNMEVNHINGIHTDNHYANLEWCTRQENLKHSYAVLLRDKDYLSREILVWDTELDSGKHNILEFKSITNAAMKLRINRHKLQECLNEKTFRLTDKRYMVKYKTDEREFPELKNVMEASYSRPIIIWNIKDDIECKNPKEYESSVFAAKDIGCSESLVRLNLYKEKPTIFAKQYVVIYKTLDSKFPSLEEVYKNSKYNPIIAINSETKEKVICETIVELSKTINMSKETITYKLKYPNNKSLHPWNFNYTYQLN